VASSKSAGFRWTVPAAVALARAKATIDRIRQTPLDPARVVYVAGVADETACDVVVDDAAPEGRRVRVMASARGDGRVLWDTGIPNNVRTFYMDTVHGDLANDRRHFGAIVDLLNTGTTTRLMTAPPVRRDADERFELREQIPAMVPDEVELISDALGGRRARTRMEPPRRTVSLRVVHDNLTNAEAPVLVSHYKDDVIVAAEAYLDRRLGGRLTELHRMELYPGPLNTGVVVLNDTTGDLATHPGAIVAGLGIVGDLTPGGLTSTLAHALTLYGADAVGRERRKRQRETGEFVGGGVVSAPVAAVLVGSGEGGLSLMDSIRSLIAAVQQANQRLRGRDADGSEADSRRLVAQIDSVDIIELFEDRAIEALHLLRTLQLSPEYDGFSVQRWVTRGDGGAQRVRFNQPSSWWQRIAIKKEKSGALRFEAVTQSARAPARLLPLQRGQVDTFVQQAKGTTAYNPRLGRTLFEMLVPNDFKVYAPERQKLALMLEPETAALPWELLEDGFDRNSEPLSVAGGMLRQLLVPDGRQHPLRAQTDTALVIGNPYVSDSRFADLPGAEAEASAVAAVLSDSGNWQVTEILKKAATPDGILYALHEKPWRILHIAGHGVYDFDRGDGGERISGLVLDNGLFFTAADADQIRYVPELVFINCCHLGNTQGDSSTTIPFHKLAANLATQFIGMGARAVIAAGWAVDDAAAKTFATTFYQYMVSGLAYGDAMRLARRDTYAQHGHTNTWGAYQCYGDPYFSLHAGKDEPEPTEFVSESELRVWLDQMRTRARERDGDIAAEIEILNQRIAGVPETWWTEASDLTAAVAQTFFELREFRTALAYFQRVSDAERPSASIRALEEFVNCRTRWALELGRVEESREEALELLDKADNQLRSLLELGKTSERWALRGSVMKRRAMLATKDRRATLQQMAAAYGNAYEVSKANGTGDTYPFGNYIAAEVVLGWMSDDVEAERTRISKLLDEFEQAARARVTKRTNAFNLTAAADKVLLEALAARNLNEDARRNILRKFREAVSRGASAKARDSMRTQFEFFKTMAETEFPEPGRKDMIESLQELRDSLAL
jgi:hypothetical protein